MSKAAERQSQRDRILEAALQHIPFEGWNRRSLLAGAADVGIDAATARRLFPRGGDDLLAHLDVWTDRRLVEAVDQRAIERLRMRERIARLVRMRLEILSPHREAMRRAIAARLLPSNAVAAGPALWRSVDLIWAIAGDRADDASYYTKRGLLLAVWTSTFFYWLEDHSPGLEDSWAFLDRRIDNVMQIGKLRAQVEGLFKNLERFNPLKA
ncbi:MAG: COQ9 family protein [Alphaproteobacteria bacterium]|nr:COQ9 family protein [Alphaproteobacteria bacterium]